MEHTSTNTNREEYQQTARRQRYIEKEKATATFMSQVFTMMGCGVGLTALASFLVSQNPALMTFLFTGAMLYATLFIPFVYSIILLYTYRKMDTIVATGAFLAYSVLMGISLGYIPIMYPIATLFGAFGVTSASFISLAVFGYTTKKNMSGWGNFLFMSLIGLILAMVVSVFIPTLSIFVSIAGVLLFSALTAYDTQQIKDIYEEHGESGNLVVIGAISLYLDFINLLLFVLRCFGGGSSD